MGMEEQPRCELGGQGSSSPAAPDGCQGSGGTGCCGGSTQNRVVVSSSQVGLWAHVPNPRAARVGDEPWTSSTWGLPAPRFSDGLGQETCPHRARPRCQTGRQGTRRAGLGSHRATAPLPNRKNMAKCGLFLQNDPKKPTMCPPGCTCCNPPSAHILHLQICSCSTKRLRGGEAVRKPRKSPEGQLKQLCQPLLPATGDRPG